MRLIRADDFEVNKKVSKTSTIKREYINKQQVLEWLVSLIESDQSGQCYKGLKCATEFIHGVTPAPVEEVCYGTWICYDYTNFGQPLESYVKCSECGFKFEYGTMNSLFPPYRCPECDARMTTRRMVSKKQLIKDIKHKETRRKNDTAEYP